MNKHTRVIPLASALLFSFFALQGSAAAQVTVYADINYSGSSQTFQGDVPNLVDAGFNDTISSIRIPSGQQWQFCQDVNFQGSCQTLQGSIADLRRINYNDQISSLRPVGGSNYGGGVFGNNRSVRGGGTMVVFANPNFRGRSATLNGDIPDIRQYGMNDQITSLQIPNGETWEICVDINYEGQCQTVNSSVSDLRDVGWNDRISSMRRVGRGYRARRNDRYNDRYNDAVGTSGSYNQDGLVFYNQPNFRGAATFIAGGAAGNVARTGSVQVRGDGVYEVCDNYGDCARIDRDVNDLRSLGLSGRITSVREVSQGRRWNPFRR
jgi:hypothetical protein